MKSTVKMATSVTFILYAVCFLLVQQVSNTNAAPTNNKVEDETLNYMVKLGYYEPPKGGAAGLEEESGIKQAIMKMQRFAGISPSGIIDSETRKLMKTPRCGMKDMSRNLIGAKRKRRYTLQGSKWQKKDLTWKLVNDNNDGLTREQVEQVLTNAFHKWHKITNLNFRKLQISDQTEPDIVISFDTGDHRDPYPFDGPGGTLAHAFYPHNNKGLSGDVHFDDDEVYSIGSSQGKSLLWVAVHEIGHTIGLEHSNIKQAVMFPYYRGNGGADFDLTQDDIMGAKHLYGSRATDPDNQSTTMSPPSITQTSSTEPGMTLPPVSPCINQFKAVLLHRTTEKTYIFNDGFVFVLAKDLGMVKQDPTPVRAVFEGLDSVDSLYYNKRGEIVVFSGINYYIYNDIKGSQIEFGTIQDKYGVNAQVRKIDAAFIWSGNGRTYLFAEAMYYRFDEARASLDYGYPKAIAENWNGLPAKIDAVSIWRNKVTYFFKDEKFYRFNDEEIKVQKGYPKPINPIWTKCSVSNLESANRSASVMSYASMVTTVVMALVTKFLL